MPRRHDRGVVRVVLWCVQMRVRVECCIQSSKHAYTVATRATHRGRLRVATATLKPMSHCCVSTAIRLCPTFTVSVHRAARALGMRDEVLKSTCLGSTSASLSSYMATCRTLRSPACFSHRHENTLSCPATDFICLIALQRLVLILARAVLAPHELP